MKKIWFTVGMVFVILLASCGEDDSYATKDNISGSTKSMTKVESEADFSFYTTHEYLEEGGMVSIKSDGREYLIQVLHIDDERIDAKNKDDVYDNSYIKGMYKEDMQDDFEVVTAKESLRDFDIYTYEYNQKTTQTGIFAFPSKSYLIPYENGTVEVNVIMYFDNDFEISAVEEILNTIY